MSARIADVLIPLALDTAYSYRVPDGLGVVEGDVVVVPLGTREVAGVVWGLSEGGGANLKAVSGKIDAPRLSPALRKLFDWLAWYTLAPRGSALALGLRIPELRRNHLGSACGSRGLRRPASLRHAPACSKSLRTGSCGRSASSPMPPR